MEIKRNRILSQEEIEQMANESIAMMEEINAYNNVIAVFEGNSNVTPKRETYSGDSCWFNNKVLVPMDVVDAVIRRFKTNGYYVWKKTSYTPNINYYAVTKREISPDSECVEC